MHTGAGASHDGMTRLPAFGAGASPDVMTRMPAFGAGASPDMMTRMPVIPYYPPELLQASTVRWYSGSTSKSSICE